MALGEAGQHAHAGKPLAGGRTGDEIGIGVGDVGMRALAPGGFQDAPGLAAVPRPGGVVVIFGEDCTASTARA
jgi:hypothetical protein